MRLRLLIAATALLATEPAAAGIVAHYRLGPGPEQRLMAIEVNDRGDSRADLGGGQVMLLLGGTAYIVETDAEGIYAVRLDDAFAASMEAWDAADRSPRNPSSDGPPPPLPPSPQVELIRGGTEIVAGRTGTLWRIHDPAAPPGASDEEFVVSADADLAPLNGLLGPRQPVSAAPLFDPNGASAARRSIYRQGAILREGRHLRLERVEIHPISGAFALPGPLLSREELAARRRRTRPQDRL